MISLIPLVLVILFPFAFLIWTVVRRKREKRRFGYEFPANHVEQVARAMCIADGRDPNAIAGLPARHSDDTSGANYVWEFYREQATRLMAALMAVDDIQGTPRRFSPTIRRPQT